MVSHSRRLAHLYRAIDSTRHSFATLPMHGQFIWYELTTPDVDAAQRFYPTFTGWGMQAFDNDYTMWTTGGLPFAGLFRLTAIFRRIGVFCTRRCCREARRPAAF